MMTKFPARPALCSTWSIVVRNPGEAFKMLGAAVPTTATFFINFVYVFTLLSISVGLVRALVLIVTIIILTLRILD